MKKFLAILHFLVCVGASATNASPLYSPRDSDCMRMFSAAIEEKERLEQYFNNRIARSSGPAQSERVCMLYRLWDMTLHEIAAGLDHCGYYSDSESVNLDSLFVGRESTRFGCDLH